MKQSKKEEAENFSSLYREMKEELLKSNLFDTQLSGKLKTLLDDTELTGAMQSDLFRCLLSRLRGLYIKDYFSDQLHINSPESDDSSDSEECSEVVRILKSVGKPIDYQVSMQIYMQIKDRKNEIKFTVIDFLLKNTNIEQNNIQYLVCLCWPDFPIFKERAHNDFIMQTWLQALDIFLTHPQWKDTNLKFMDTLNLSFFADNQTIGAQVQKAKFWISTPPKSPKSQRVERFEEQSSPYALKVC